MILSSQILTEGQRKDTAEVSVMNGVEDCFGINMIASLRLQHYLLYECHVKGKKKSDKNTLIGNVVLVSAEHNEQLILLNPKIKGSYVRWAMKRLLLIKTKHISTNMALN